MQQLGVNTIRVYNLATDVNHDQCASIFNAAGIYMILDVNNPLQGQYLDRTDPGSTYTFDYLNHVFGIIEAFANYPNTLGFFAANEIINQQSTGEVPAYLRAVVRDMNDYIEANIGRKVGVGYSAADVEDLLEDTWNYLACNVDNSTNSKIDFFGLNDYEWCGQNTFTGAGWNKLVALFDGTTIPVFL
jgi:1,3-beta-glucanosyltransferase GAS3